ncbi:MAG: zinc-ribbon domain-containing protein [Oscillospiraceae bacterium]|nr:zinc-ribbon domain-containing protein [Oscillospiraceae bacterium]
MSFLDDVITTGKNVVSTAGTKGKDAVNFSKLKIRVSQLNGEVKTKFEKLGEMIYEMAKSGEKNNEAFDEMVSEIDAIYDELADIDKQVDELRNVVTCTKCGAKTSKENAYCPKCGEKLPEKPVEEASETEE